jgi:ABC-type multidrug transport system fused ATPase/permease subunit
VLTVPLSVLLARLIAKHASGLFTAQAVGSARLTAHIEEIYSGIDLVQAFERRDWAHEQFARHNADVNRAGRYAARCPQPR